MHAFNSIINFSNKTTVVGLITINDETAYMEEVMALGAWCRENNLSLNVNKGMIVDFMKQQREHPTTMGPQWRRWKASSSSAYTSLTN
jgi:hypothetical protein